MEILRNHTYYYNTFYAALLICCSQQLWGFKATMFVYFSRGNMVTVTVVNLAGYVIFTVAKQPTTWQSWKIMRELGCDSPNSVPLEAQVSLVGFSAGERTAPWGCRRRMRGCRERHPRCHTSVRDTVKYDGNAVMDFSIKCIVWKETDNTATWSVQSILTLAKTFMT